MARVTGSFYRIDTDAGRGHLIFRLYFYIKLSLIRSIAVRRLTRNEAKNSVHLYLVFRMTWTMFSLNFPLFNEIRFNVQKQRNVSTRFGVRDSARDNSELSLVSARSSKKISRRDYVLKTSEAHAGRCCRRAAASAGCGGYEFLERFA